MIRVFRSRNLMIFWTEKNNFSPTHFNCMLREEESSPCWPKVCTKNSFQCIFAFKILFIMTTLVTGFLYEFPTWNDSSVKSQYLEILKIWFHNDVVECHKYLTGCQLLVCYHLCQGRAETRKLFLITKKLVGAFVVEQLLYDCFDVIFPWFRWRWRQNTFGAIESLLQWPWHNILRI